ncbi:DUF2732 family protein [Candidatus Sodalis sp. SoCistrobi]|uniref:DUF2732 family protein n=1 Tax=Candidatus Sodalis sp. SoCistrobi TaxID=1922216 RepID=UPI00093A9537|nr:DUF2732 family protein [Candidatus Sodalis sp. SoCistrobi]
MQNVDDHNTEIMDAKLRQVLVDLCENERRHHAAMMTRRFEILALEIDRRRLSGSEAAELLRNTADTLSNQAQGID